MEYYIVYYFNFEVDLLRQHIYKKNNDRIIKEIQEGIKKYYHNSMTRGIVGPDNKTSLALIGKICEFHGYEIIDLQVAKVLIIFIACLKDYCV